MTFVLAAAMLVSLNSRLWPMMTAGIIAVASVVAAAGLFASLAGHALIHVLAARGAGVPARRLTLFVLGGVTDVEGAPASPRSEVVGALAASAASVVAALALGIGLAIATAPLPRSLTDLGRLGLPGTVLLEIAAANLAVAIVNMLPAFPLDGGRLLRAMLWRSTHDVARATRISAWSGEVVGWVAVLGGIVTALFGLPIAGGAIALLGWFITSAAAQGFERFAAESAGS